jgi:hypothetical protein
MISNNTLVKQLKKENQDFEFYPTTAQIANIIYTHLAKYSSILDIGAGNGIFFRLIEEIDNKHKECEERYSSRMGEKYAIEKSRILIDNMSKDIALIGTDFYNQTLIDKKVDCVFCNPPYSACEEWSTKIIREANAKQIFIVMPIAKWNKSKTINEAIKAREASFECLLKYDYNKSEFRKARTIVGVYKISLCHENTYIRNEEAKVDPFDLWFDENFKFSEPEKKESFSQRMEEHEKKSLVTGRNLIERLELMYNEDLSKTQKVYKTIAQTPVEVLKELGIEKETISRALKMKIKETKNLYWQELFKNLDVITRKLTNASRQKIGNKLTSSTNVDFSASNAYAVVCWVLKNANSYFDEQLVEVYKNLTRADNVKPYKSNHRFTTDDFRWCRHGNENVKKYKLDYRIILSGHSHCLNNPYTGREVALNDYHNQYTFSQVQDIFTVASNLGFEFAGQYHGFPVHGWEYGKERKLYTRNGEILAAIKIYKNGNFHFRLNVKFMKAFNIEAGRLLGWLKSPQHAADELEINADECLKFFKSNLSLDNSNIKLLN